MGAIGNERLMDVLLITVVLVAVALLIRAKVVNRSKEAKAWKKRIVGQDEIPVRRGWNSLLNGELEIGLETAGN